MSIISIVQSATLDFTPQQACLPPFVWNIFSVLNRVHGLWRWYRKAELYRNPNNLAQLFTGHAVNYMCGELALLKIAAQCLLIATRILECCQQQAALAKEAKNLRLLLKGSYPHSHYIKWITPNSNQMSWLSPSDRFQWNYFVNKTINKIVLIGKTVFQMLLKAVHLSMHMLDTIDAFYFSPTAQNEGINEMFVNIFKWLDVVINQKELLLSGLSQNQKLIEKILQSSPLTYQQLYESVRNSVEKTSYLCEKVQKVTQLGNQNLLHFGKKTVHSGLCIAGLT
jgi:hypothetical protein